MFTAELGINYQEVLGRRGRRRNTLIQLGLMSDDKNTNHSTKGCRELWDDSVGSASQKTNPEARAEYVQIDDRFMVWADFCIPFSLKRYNDKCVDPVGRRP